MLGPPTQTKLLLRLEFVTTFVCYGQFLTTFCAACCQYATTISGGHSLKETVFVTALALGGLECTFHCSINLCPSQGGLHKMGCKITAFF